MDRDMDTDTDTEKEADVDMRGQLTGIAKKFKMPESRSVLYGNEKK
jgi:hypothetical protein